MREEIPEDFNFDTMGILIALWQYQILIISAYKVKAPSRDEAYKRLFNLDYRSPNDKDGFRQN